MDNAQVASTMERLAGLLETQRANPFRVAAWRAAAAKTRASVEPLAATFQREGLEGLKQALNVGDALASALRELLSTGRLQMLERLEGQLAPEDQFLRVPGLGPTLAHNLHEQLGLDTLEELEQAAHDGRLKKVRGFGARRIALVREAVDGLLRHSMRSRYRTVSREGPEAPRPAVATLLQVDAHYQREVASGTLTAIAPRRFNPGGAAWLPVLHTELEGYSFTALFSNTARAHKLGRTRDWVVLYFERDGHESQCTVVTELRGPLEGKRVVRGREAECAAYYGSPLASAHV